MPNVKVSLSKPVVVHKTHHELEFREPKWGDYADLGEPYVWAQSAENAELSRATPIWETVKTYAERLLVNEDGPPVLDQLNVVDGFKVRDAIMGFFLAGDPRVSVALTMSQTTSSLNSGGDPATSQA